MSVKPPFLTLTLIAINCAVYGVTSHNQDLLYWAGINSQVFTQLQLWKLLTAGFVHLNLFHLLGNMAYLFVLGGLFERRSQYWFLGIYFGSIIVPAAITAIVFTMQHSSLTAIGASTGVMGLIGAYGVLLLQLRQTRAWWIEFSFYTFLMGLCILSNFAPRLNWIGHLAGFISGAAIWLLSSYEHRLKPFERKL